MAILPQALIAVACMLLAAQTAAATDETAQAEYRWKQSPQGAMLERILPPAIAPSQLPEPSSAGARLAAAYCVQCHYLPNPAMHNAQKWPAIVARMVWRMQGRGNLGKVMQDMMADVKAPDAGAEAALVRYLQKHAQRELDPAQYPDIHTPAGRIFSIACSQCHVLPDPRRHTAREWPQVVERMRRNMQWANRITGDAALRTSPELDTGEIVRFLQRNSRER
jgi:mono/diheme cytochrome c family protein